MSPSSLGQAQRSRSVCPYSVFLIKYALLLFLFSPLEAESLRYTLKWPSGLSLGEATLSTSLTAQGTASSLDLDASLPAYTIQDRYSSSTSAQSCTIQFTREAIHGSKKINERIIVSPEGKITRETANGGGVTEIPTVRCPHDALALLVALRRNYAQPAQSVLFGQGYPVRFEAATTETIALNDVPTAADKLICILTLPKTGDYRLELYFLKDRTHTPALIKAPFALGTFSMELVR